MPVPYFVGFDARTLETLDMVVEIVAFFGVFGDTFLKGIETHAAIVKDLVYLEGNKEQCDDCKNYQHALQNYHESIHHAKHSSSI